MDGIDYFHWLITIIIVVKVIIRIRGGFEGRKERSRYTFVLNVGDMKKSSMIRRLMSESDAVFFKMSGNGLMVVVDSIVRLGYTAFYANHKFSGTRLE